MLAKIDCQSKQPHTKIILSAKEFTKFKQVSLLWKDIQNNNEQKYLIFISEVPLSKTFNFFMHEVPSYRYLLHLDDLEVSWVLTWSCYLPL